jgi:hypothetical protein
MFGSNTVAPDDETWAPLADLSHVPIADQISDEAGAVDQALRRVQRTFGSFVSGD